MGLPSTVSDEGAAKTTTLSEGPRGDKDSEGLKPPTDMEPQTNTVADPSGTDAKRYGEDTQADEEEHQSPPPNTDKPEPSPAQDTQESDYDSSSPELKKYDNILPLTQRQLHKEAAVSYAGLKASIEGYYEENVDHREQTDKLVQATMDRLDKHSTDRAKLLKALNEVIETLKFIHDAVKEDLALNKKVLEATEAYTTHSTNISELLSLAKTFDFFGLKSLVKTVKAALDAQNDHMETWAKSSTSMAWNVSPGLTKIEHTQAFMQADLSSLKSDSSELKSMMTEIYQAFKESPSHTEGEHVAIEDDTKKPESNKAEEEPTNPESSQAPKRTDKGKKIATGDIESPVKLVLALKMVREDPDEPIRVPYMINGKMYHLINDEINEHLKKEDKIKKTAEKAKRLEMTKTKVIKIVQEEAEKIGIDPKKVISAKAGEKFKKVQDAEMQVHKRQHIEKTKRLMELNKKRAEQYKWTIFIKLKPGPITDVKMHPNSKPAILTIYRNNDKRNFNVHNPFKFSDFGLTELDELGSIIQKKKNTIVKDLMTSLGKRYERLKKIPEELGIQSTLPAHVPKQDQSQSSRRKRKHMELEPKIKVPRLE
ncbi:hypothetical protein Tco_1402716 [Tanacetum coccineum]